VQYHNDAGTGEHLIGDSFRIYEILVKKTNAYGIPMTQEQFNSEKEEVIKRFSDGMKKKTGFDDWFYESRSTYAEDALHCYSQHHRPTQGCSDWWSDSKRIGRPTEVGRAVLKELPGKGKTDPHICSFCPVASYVRTEVNFRKGLYK
jgi:glutathionylspermidine synthase